MARIVFDLDGTLIDSAPDIHGIANALLAAEGKEPITLDQARDFIGNGASVFVSKMRAARDIADDQYWPILDWTNISRHFGAAIVFLCTSRTRHH